MNGLLPSTPSISDSGKQSRSYVSYAYSYPHKSAYGQSPPELLGRSGGAECRDSLFLYIHVPFCEMRCGFCNSFARAGGENTLVEAYLDALEPQAHVLADIRRVSTVARFAIGGIRPLDGDPNRPTGSHCRKAFQPTVHSDLHRGFAEDRWPSPATLRERRRTVSIGVQSFAMKAHAIGRAAAGEQRAALDCLPFPTLNIDLITDSPPNCQNLAGVDTNGTRLPP